MSLLFATENRGKLAEIRALFSALPVEILSLADVLPGRSQVAEDGVTFEENASLKARAAASETMLVTLAEDAGLEVDALGGRPGVRSARFAGLGATDAENNAALLSALQEVDEPQRIARFRTVLALVDPWADAGVIVTAGQCEGTIAREARGTGGFGYDPLFVVAGYGRTMAELTGAEKNIVSHRAQAAAAMLPTLEGLVRDRIDSSLRIARRG